MQNRNPIPRDQIALPDFTPVPRRRRHDGWTDERQRAFIEALADTGSVRAAAKRINMSSEGAYYLRRQPGAEQFAAAWDVALDYGVQQLADIALDRAREGVPVPVYWRGEQVGEKRRFNDRLLMFILKHHMPSRYGADLPRGTRHPDTIAREAAEHCPVCRANAEAAAAAEAAADDPEVEVSQWLEAVIHRYHAKIQSERAYRLSGQIVAADFTLRQLTHIELILDLGGRSQDLITAWTNLNSPPPGTMPDMRYASPISEELDQLRRETWAEAGEPPRPELNFPELVPYTATQSGPTADARAKARQEAETAMAWAQRIWEATATEEGWRIWQAVSGEEPSV